MISARNLLVAYLCLIVCGCASTRPPLSYLSLEKPTGIIRTVKPMDVKKDFLRGGWYVLNYNFRPAADMQFYIEEVQKESNSTILRNADIRLNVPVAFDVLMFGFNRAKDSIILKADAVKNEKVDPKE